MELTAYRGEEDEPGRIRRMLEVAGLILQFQDHHVIDAISAIHDHKGNWTFTLKRRIADSDMEMVEDMASAMYGEEQCEWYLQGKIFREDGETK